MPDEWQGHPQRKDYPLEGPGELLMENPRIGCDCGICRMKRRLSNQVTMGGRI